MLKVGALLDIITVVEAIAMEVVVVGGGGVAGHRDRHVLLPGGLRLNAEHGWGAIIVQIIATLHFRRLLNQTLTRHTRYLLKRELLIRYRSCL